MGEVPPGVSYPATPPRCAPRRASVASESRKSHYRGCAPPPAIAVEESDLIRLEHHLLLLVAHPQHKAQGHPPGPEFFGIATMLQVGQVVARVGVSQATALRVEDAIEASLGLPLRRRLPLLLRRPSLL